MSKVTQTSSTQVSETTAAQQQRRLVTPERRPLFIVLAALAFIAAVWFSLIFIVPKPPTVEQRVHNIAAQLRCPVCQNESVADAPSTVAQDIRKQIQQQVLAGKSDQQIIQFFIDRYGEQTIIYAPQWQGFSILMWVVPILLLLGGMLLIFFVIRDWQASSVPEPVVAGTVDVSARSVRGSGSNRASHLSEQRELSAEERELEQYRKLLEEELVADDPLFKRSTTEA
jgi:cytochrome c-type biogenesis protein CcmH